MAQLTAAFGICHSLRSKTTASTVTTTPVIAVIQNDSVSVGTSMRVRRSNWVPKAQLLAASNASATPAGRPARPVSSCHSSRPTPSAAAPTPSQARRLSAAENRSEPTIAEKIGMV